MHPGLDRARMTSRRLFSMKHWREAGPADYSQILTQVVGEIQVATEHQSLRGKREREGWQGKLDWEGC